jgi:hypothetical protein
MSACPAKRIALAAALFAAAAQPAFALFGLGDIVFDPTAYGWNILHESKELIHWAEEIKKFEDFLAQQIATAEKITDLRNGIHSRLGDWQGVYDRAVSLRNRAENLRAPVGGEFSLVAVVDYGRPALLYSNHGNFGAIGTTTAYGTKFEVEDTRLKRYQAVFAINDDIEKSVGQAEKETREVLGEIADTSRDIVAATDQEKLAKLQEKKSTLVLRLQELQRQLDQKIKLLTIQTTLNENRAALERDVKREQVRQTFREARARDAALVDK